MGLLQNDTLILDLEPLHGIFLGHPLVDPNTGLASASPGDAVSSTLQNDKEVHTPYHKYQLMDKVTTYKFSTIDLSVVEAQNIN